MSFRDKADALSCSLTGPLMTHSRHLLLDRDVGRNAKSSMKGEAMKIVVIGGTGLIGSKVVSKLTQRGHEALAAAPNTGVNTITGRIPLLCCPT